MAEEGLVELANRIPLDIEESLKEAAARTSAITPSATNKTYVVREGKPNSGWQARVIKKYEGNAFKTDDGAPLYIVELYVEKTGEWVGAPIPYRADELKEPTSQPIDLADAKSSLVTTVEWKQQALDLGLTMPEMPVSDRRMEPVESTQTTNQISQEEGSGRFEQLSLSFDQPTVEIGRPVSLSDRWVQQELEMELSGISGGPPSQEQKIESTRIDFATATDQGGRRGGDPL